MSDRTLLSAIVTHEEDATSEGGFRVQRFNLGGEPQAAAIVAAVGANYHRILGREKPTQEALEARIGERVTLITQGETMMGTGVISAREGTLKAFSRGLGILPKGARSKGYSVTAKNVVDVVDGWSLDEAAELVGQARDFYPQLRKLTKERLEELPGEDQGGEMCTLAVFGTYRLPDCTSHDAIWLIGEYWPEDDICDRNVLLVRPEHGTSEHGSCWGRDILRMDVGEIVGFQPISFREAIELCSVDYDEASARIFDGSRAVA